MGLAACASVAAGEVEPPERLQAVAQAFATEYMAAQHGPGAVAQVSPPDRRLRLVRCAQSPEAFLPPGTNAGQLRAVGVRCAGPKPWKLYLSTQTTVTRPVVVAARALTRGERVAAQDLRVVEKDVSRLTGGYYEESAAVAGRELTRSVQAGAPLAPNALRDPVAVARGERVTLVSATGPVEVRVAAVALADAAVGGLVDVENSDSGRRVQGRVEAPGLVRAGAASVY